MSYRLSGRALIDLESIVDYLSAINPNAAHRLVDKLEERWELLVTQPRSSVPRHDLGPNLREVIVGGYLSTIDWRARISRYCVSFMAGAI
jgi:plasmid stabilization system protein ParE